MLLLMIMVMMMRMKTVWMMCDGCGVTDVGWWIDDYDYDDADDDNMGDFG